MTAWSAPVVALAVAAPAAAGSNSDVPPRSAFVLGLTASAAPLGPVSATVRINYNGADPALPAVGQFTWTLTLQREGDPTGFTAGSGLATVARGARWQELVVSGVNPMPVGYYTATLLVAASDGVASIVRTVRVSVAAGDETATMAEISLSLAATYRRRPVGDDVVLVLTTTYTGPVTDSSILVEWQASVLRPGSADDFEFFSSTSRAALGDPGRLEFTYPVGPPLPPLPPGSYVFTARAEVSDGEVVATRTIVVPG